LTIANQNFLDYWAAVSGSEALQQAAQTDAKARRAFLKQHQLLDLLQQHPGVGAAQAFADSLRSLQPRLYDVANAIDTDTDEIHLLVQAYQYSFITNHDTFNTNQDTFSTSQDTPTTKKISGVATEYLLQLQPGETVSIYPHHNKRFHLPEQTDVPLILIGWGTGMAPFRAFMQRIVQSERAHPCWLMFGEQSFEDDFLYQLDWQQASSKGILQRLDTVFIDDQPGEQLSDPLVAQLPQLAD